MIQLGRTVAWLNLAWNFGRHVVVRMPVRLAGRDGGAQKFRDAVLPEGYAPLVPAEREAMPRFMNCVHCGLCALACPDDGTGATASASAWDDAWTFVAGASRSLDRANIVAANLSPCAERDEPARVCPMGVPIPVMAATIRRLAAEQQHAQGER